MSSLAEKITDDENLFFFFKTQWGVYFTVGWL
jgi:hypothetical protein